MYVLMSKMATASVGDFNCLASVGCSQEGVSSFLSPPTPSGWHWSNKRQKQKKCIAFEKTEKEGRGERERESERKWENDDRGKEEGKKRRDKQK